MFRLAARRGRSRFVLAISVALAGCLAVAACEANRPSGTPPSTPPPSASPSSASPSPTPGPSVDVLAIYRQIEDEIIAIRGLDATARLEPTVIDPETLAANVTAEFDRSNKPEDLAKDEALLIALGLLPAGTSLRDAYLDLQGGTVIGYYSPEDKTLFVVSRSGALGATEKATFAHEFTHALQDQNFDLDSLGTDDLSNGDRAFARLSMVEGDATAAQVEWIIAHLTQSELTQLLADASDPEVLATFARAPAILRESSLFPYQTGLEFVQALQSRAGGSFEAVNDAFKAPPNSTSQIIHPELYPKTEPLPVEDLAGFAEAAGSGWTERREDTLGEFTLSIWLSENGVSEIAAATATVGWAGDRVALFEGPNDDHAVLLVSDWRSPGDGDEFETAARSAIDSQDVDNFIRVSTDRVVLVFGTDRAAVNAIADQVRSAGCC